MGRRPAILSIVLPAYNEASRLPHTLEDVARAFSDPVQIIVVDDGSTDATPELLERLHKEHPGLEFLRVPENRGKGNALRLGCALAKGDTIAFFDADGDIPAAECRRLAELLASRDDVDAVIGSKRLPASRRAGWSSPLRRTSARAGNFLVRLLLLPGIRDTQCGVKVFRAWTLSTVVSATTRDRWSFDIELLALLHRRGSRIIEEPVEWVELGETHVRPRDYLATLLDLFAIAIELRLKGRP